MDNTCGNAIKGVITPAITPFRADGEIDEAALVPYLDFLAGQVHGVSVCAIYGAGILMRPEQRRRVVEIAAEVLKGKSALVVFVGAADTDTAVLLAEHAQRAGATAVTCVTPFYYRQVDEALFRHFKALIDAVDIPVLAYDSPVYAGNQLSFELIERLAAAGLAGIITGAAGYGIEHLWEYCRRFAGSDFRIVSMRDGLMLPAMMMGTIAVESGVSNFLPEIVLELYRAIEQRRYADASQLQQQVLTLRDMSHSFNRNIPTLHALIEMRGFMTGIPKRPFFSFNEADIEQLRTRVAAIAFARPFLGS